MPTMIHPHGVLLVEDVVDSVLAVEERAPSSSRCSSPVRAGVVRVTVPIVLVGVSPVPVTNPSPPPPPQAASARPARATRVKPSPPRASALAPRAISCAMRTSVIPVEAPHTTPIG